MGIRTNPLDPVFLSPATKNVLVLRLLLSPSSLGLFTGGSSTNHPAMYFNYTYLRTVAWKPALGTIHLASPAASTQEVLYLKMFQIRWKKVNLLSSIRHIPHEYC